MPYLSVSLHYNKQLFVFWHTYISILEAGNFTNKHFSLVSKKTAKNIFISYYYRKAKKEKKKFQNYIHMRSLNI